MNRCYLRGQFTFYILHAAAYLYHRLWPEKQVYEPGLQNIERAKKDFPA
jgi:hypothetical protein